MAKKCRIPALWLCGLKSFTCDCKNRILNRINLCTFHIMYMILLFTEYFSSGHSCFKDPWFYVFFFWGGGFGCCCFLVLQHKIRNRLLTCEFFTNSPEEQRVAPGVWRESALWLMNRHQWSQEQTEGLRTPWKKNIQNCRNTFKNMIKWLKHSHVHRCMLL